jgi:L-asparaginase/Glu-tRNA(Gln) amidotransferase subunit D
VIGDGIVIGGKTGAGAWSPSAGQTHQGAHDAGWPVVGLQNAGSG